MDDNQLYLGFEGGANHRASLAGEPAVREFLAATPPAPAVAIDLGEATFLDSTFAGWLIRLQNRLRQAGGRLIVTGCAEICRSSLEIMGLTSLFTFEPRPAPPQARRIGFSDLEDADAETIEFMLHAHETLSHVNPQNERVFTPIAEALRDELKKRRQS